MSSGPESSRTPDPLAAIRGAVGAARDLQTVMVDAGEELRREQLEERRIPEVGNERDTAG